MEYVITTERLGLRNWNTADLEPFQEMNQDELVMRYFPKILSPDETNDLYNRMRLHFSKYGFCYFAVDVLETGEFIGMVGMLHQTFVSDFTPSVDIGWRIRPSAWGKGYATEAAKACVKAGFEDFGLEKIYSYAPKINGDSIAIMKKIGMKHIGEFEHPKLLDDLRLKDCDVYLIAKNE